MTGNAFLIATAGHVDHGKTSLVRALTGIDTDRLPEEKSRAISIECGFASTMIGPHLISFVDVPGHERFIRQMVGGVGGMDMVLLVVGADEGVMPQTREHLDICRFTGIRKLVVALTRADLVDGEWLALVRAEIIETIAKSPWPDAPIVTCSALDGTGLDVLKTTLTHLLDTFDSTQRARSAMHPFAMPIDRVFTRPGHGTIATGTCLHGTVKAGDVVRLFPESPRDGIRIRQVEQHGSAIAAGMTGSRLALNLAGVDHHEVPRGSIVATAPGADAHSVLETRLEVARGIAKPIERGDAVIFQIGHFTCEARVFPYEDKPIGPGMVAAAEIRADRPVPWIPGMAFIIRGFERLKGAGLTVGGGHVIAGHMMAIPKPRRAIRAAIVAAIGTNDLRVALESALVDQGLFGMSLANARTLLASADNFSPADLTRVIRSTQATLAGEKLFGAAVIADFSTCLITILRNHHTHFPGEAGVPRPILAKSLRACGVRALPDEHTIDLLLGTVTGVERRNDALALAGFVAQTPEHEHHCFNALADLLKTAGPMPPWRQDLGQSLETTIGQTGLPVERLVQRGLREHLFVRVSVDLIFHRDALTALIAALDAHFTTRKTLSISDFKAISGASRKWVVPLIEWLDRERFTLRRGDDRERHPAFRTTLLRASSGQG